MAYSCRPKRIAPKTVKSRTDLSLIMRNLLTPVRNSVRKFAWACIGLAALLGAATTEHAAAGVNAWTSTGPRTQWSLVAADSRQSGLVFIDAIGQPFRSTDGGAHWASVSVTGITSAEFESFWFDPKVAHRVYAAVDISGGTGSSVLKVARSDDDGASWTLIGTSFAQFSVIGTVVRTLRLEISSSDANRMYASVNGVTLTVDGGTTWHTVGPSDNPLRDLALEQTSPGTIYGVGQHGVSRSVDNGTTWQLINNGLPSVVSGLSIAVDPAASEHLLLIALVGAPGAQTKVLYASHDHGASWVSTNASFSDVRTDQQIVFDPSSSSTVYVRSAGMVSRSTDGGTTWQSLALLHGAPVNSLSVNGTGTVYAAADNDGFLRSDDHGSTWLAENAGLPGGKTLKLAAVANDHFTLFGLVRIQNAFENVVTAHRRGSSSNLWMKAFAGSQALGSFGTSARNSGRVVANANNLNGPRFASDDAGVTWQPLASVTTFNQLVDSYVFFPDSDAKIFASGELVPLLILGYSPGAFASTRDGGANWQDHTPALQIPSVHVLTVDPLQPNVVYAGSGVEYFPPAILRSTDGGDHWSALPLPPIAVSRATGILVNPNNSQQIIASFVSPSSMYQSSDSGQTWTPIGNGLTDIKYVNALVVDWAQMPPLLYAGTDQGVFTSPLVPANGAWSRIGGSENLAVNDLRLDRPPASTDRLTVTAATDTGVWEYTFDPAGALEPVFRFFNTQTSAHFYTASASERDHVLATWPQFVYEGTAFFAAAAPSPGTLSIYRFYNTQTGAHFYTASVAERDHVLATWPQFLYEGVRFYAFADSEPGSVKLYRFFNTQTGAHFYTAQDDERDAVDQHLLQFVDEGVVYNVYPAASQQ
jgi:photosystem II stability/assembly factor-like uncharacterized protein